MKYLIWLLIFLTSLISINLPAQTANNTGQLLITSDTNSNIHSKNEMDGVEDDFAPGLFFMLVFGVILVLLRIGAGIILTILLILSIFAFLSLGLLSVSIVVAINQQSFTQGFKTFVWTVTTLLSTMTLTAGTWLFNYIMHWWSTEKALTIGVLSGLISGLFLGYILTIIIQKVSQFLENRFRTSL